MFIDGRKKHQTFKAANGKLNDIYKRSKNNYDIWVGNSRIIGSNLSLKKAKITLTCSMIQV